MLIHISRARYDRIRALTVSIKRHPWRRYQSGDTEYHILAGEAGWCKHCSGEFTSVDAATPLQLDSIKRQIAKQKENDADN